MLTIFILVCVCFSLFDGINLLELRKLVYSFLLSKRNIKGARKIHAEQTKCDRFTLAYIENYAIHKREFCFFQKLLVIYYYTVIPQYLLLILVGCFSITACIVLISIFFVLKIIAAVIIRANFSADRISRFDKRYK